ncbi:MAG TPA: alpha/beta fold hydrolase [Polyangiaceae bacterium]|nr:alpha/beta fold hydrolase [Polyangiaceae bacterium]
MAYVRTRLGRWFYEERGEGAAERPVVALLHGLLFDGGMFRAQVEPLAAFARVLVFDGPGHGKSEVPPPFTLEDHADALMDAFDALDVRAAALVGLSWGGMVAMRVALRHPERVRALALLDTSAELEEPARRVKYRLFASFGRRFGLPKALVDHQLARVFFADRTLRERPELLDRFTRAANGFPREGLARAAIAVLMRKTEVLSRLGAIRAPTLVLTGREDHATEPPYAERIAAGIAGARLVLVDDCGHSSTVERPDEVNAALVPFLREALRPS